jgi:hypothetical protein
MEPKDDIALRRDAGLLRALKTAPKSHKEIAEERARQKKPRARPAKKSVR